MDNPYLLENGAVRGAGQSPNRAALATRKLGQNHEIPDSLAR
jgi:hypothetical protein